MADDAAACHKVTWFGRHAIAEADRLADQLRATRSLTRALEQHLGFGLRRENRIAYSRPITRDTARRLWREMGTMVDYRDGWLVPAHGEPVRYAAVTAVVDPLRLRLDQAGRTVYDHGEVPLGKLVTEADRASHDVLRLSCRPVPADEDPALMVRATLLRAGVPVALVRELVYWRTIRQVLG